MAAAPQLAVRAEGTARFFAAGSVCCPGAAAVGCCELSGSRIQAQGLIQKQADGRVMTKHSKILPKTTLP